MFVPVVDGTFITERPTVTLDRKVVNGVSLLSVLFIPSWFIKTSFLQDVLLSVTNTFEGLGFALPNETNTTDFIRQMFPYFSAKQTDKAANYYTVLNTTSPMVSDQAAAVMGEGSYVPFTLYK